MSRNNIHLPINVVATRFFAQSSSSSRAPGTLLEIRRYVPSLSSSSIQQQKNDDDDDSLLGFVLWTGNDDRRLSGWLPLDEIFVPADGTCIRNKLFGSSQEKKNSSASSLLLDADSSSEQETTTTKIKLLLNSNPIINNKLREAVPQDLRKKLIRQHNNDLDFLEERLRRDMEIPTLHYRLHYLDCVMQPWYFAPFHCMCSEFNPNHFSSSTSLSSNNSNSQNKNNSVNTNTSSSSSFAPGNIYDVYICPFSLEPFRFESELERFLKNRLLLHAAATESLRMKQQQQQQQQKSKSSSSSSSSAAAAATDIASCLRPPGVAKYRDDTNGITVYRVSGVKYNHYCRNLLMIARCFLENKLVGHDAGIYTFYVLTLDEDQVRPSSSASSSQNQKQQNQNSNKNSSNNSQGEARVFAGYFSVEKGDPSHNLACVVVLPCFQSRGLGRLLISLSYEFAKRKSDFDISRVGTPERPLSDLGEAMYNRYWESVIWQWMTKITKSEKVVAGNFMDTAIDIDDNAADNDNNNDDNDGDSSEKISKKGGGGNRNKINNNLKSKRRPPSSSSSSSTFSKKKNASYDLKKMKTFNVIAEELGLSVEDTRETVLRMGLVHRNEGNFKIMMPVSTARVLSGKVSQLKNDVKDEFFFDEIY